jgi:hypothetical protein
MIDGEGHFSLAGLEPAPYRVTVGALPPPMFVKSVRFNGHDIDDDVDLTSAPGGSLDIVISDRASSAITGVVSETSSVASPSVRVVAVPSRTQGRVPSARVDADGRFSFTNLPPGKYFLMATDTGMLPAGGFNPEVFAQAGKEVTVQDGESVSVELHLTTAEELQRATLQ